MKQFVQEFWWTLTHPEEWHPVSAILVLEAMTFLLATTMGDAIYKLYR